MILSVALLISAFAFSIFAEDTADPDNLSYDSKGRLALTDAEGVYTHSAIQTTDTEILSLIFHARAELQINSAPSPRRVWALAQCSPILWVE